MRPFLLTAAAVLAAGVAAPRAVRAQAQPITFGSYACDDPSQPCEYAAEVGRPLTAGGFDFAEYGNYSLGTWSSNPSNLGSVNRPSNAGGSTALFANGNGDAIVMSQSAGRAFDLYSMDFASLFRQSSISPPLGPVRDFTVFFEYFRTPAALAALAPDGEFSATVAAAPLAGGDRVPLLRTVDFSGATAPGVSVRWLTGQSSDLLGAGVYGVAWYNASFTGLNPDGSPAFLYGSPYSHQFTNVVADVAGAQVVPEPGTFALAAGGLVLLVGAGRLGRRRTT